MKIQQTPYAKQLIVLMKCVIASDVELDGSEMVTLVMIWVGLFLLFHIQHFKPPFPIKCNSKVKYIYNLSALAVGSVSN